MISLYARLAAIASLLVALAGAGWWCYSQGKKTVTAEWTAEKLASSENARLREQAAQKSNERVDRDYQVQKSRLLADNRVVVERLRDFQAASIADTTAQPSDGDYGDPRSAILAECAGTAVVLDEAVKRMASQTTALQQFVREVCLK